MILLVALIIILLTRCEEDASSSSEQNAQWFNNFITPRDLHLPKSVIDLEREQSKKKHAK